VDTPGVSSASVRCSGSGMRAEIRTHACMLKENYTHVCLKSVIKHSSTGLYVYQLTSTCPPKSVTWNYFYPAINKQRWTFYTARIY